MCKIDNCDRISIYKKDDLCQMHYFRFMRNGTYDIVRKRLYRTSNPKGYQLLYEPTHVLSQKGGYVYEHRYILFNHSGFDLKQCCKCGKDWSWDDIYGSHVDHIDDDVTNNNLNNLRTLCNACNTHRGKKPFHTRVDSTAVDYKGEVKTPTEWARESFVSVCGSTIRRRIRAGWSVKDSLTKPSKTYKGIC